MRPTALAPEASRDPAKHPPWHAVLRTLRETRGITQEGWAARLGVSRKTVQRWERGERAPDPGAETAILDYCRQAGLFRTFDRGPLAGLTLTEERLSDLFGEARWHGGARQGSSLPSVVASEIASGAPPTSLPVQLTSFVGREREIAAVRRAQAGTRLLTMTGPGGGGKTRLALALAGELRGAYPQGIWFVDLAPLANPALVPQVVASALELRPTGRQPLTEVLIGALRARHLLLILDNCEHLVEACTPLVETLLRACPLLEILATSREPLGISGETIWRVPPLALPEEMVSEVGVGDQRPGGDSGSRKSIVRSGAARPESDIDVLLACDAVRLFVERARLQRPELAPSPAEVATIAAICRTLDGLPLAIELAAARAGALSVGQIAARLHDRFGLLSRGARTALPRHQTLAATMDWSYGLLTAPERALLRALSVFAGGFTLEAAETVCGDVGVPFADPNSQVAVLDLLSSLVDKSLVVLGDREGEPRYRLLETVRQYAREKLDAADHGEREGVPRRHAAYFLALAEAAAPKLRESPEQLAWFARLEAEHDNLRAALDWAAEHDATTGLRLAGALAWFWYIRGYFSEGRRWLERFLNAGAGGPPAVRAKALHGAVTIATMLADGPAVRAFSEQALALWRELGDWLEYARTLHNLGQWAFRWEGDLETGRALLEEALAIARQSGGAGRERTIAYCLSNLGFAIHLLGDDVTARGLLQDAVALQRQRADKDGLAMALAGLARVARAEGDAARARAQQAEALTLRRELHGPWGVAWPLSGIAELALDDRPELTARLLGVLEVMNELRGDIVVHERIDREAMTEAARRALGEAAFAREWAAGRSLPLAQAVAEALAYAATPPESSAAPPAGTAAVQPDGLTERELEVLRLLAAGKSNREIADTLVISQNTVLRHVTHILRKTGAANRTEAAVYAQRHNLAC